MKRKLPYQYIAIEGNIGAGKTSLANIISTKFNGDLVIEEFADNTFLPQFYNNQERFAFPLEMSFLAERFQQLKNQQEKSFAEGNLLISDYLFEKSLLFAQVNLKGHELDLFIKFFNMINTSLIRPDLIIFLNKSTDKLISNIEKRGRSFEKSIQPDYLDKVSNQYLNYLKSNSTDRILIINSDEIDFVENSADLMLILKLVEEKHESKIKTFDFAK